MSCQQCKDKGYVEVVGERNFYHVRELYYVPCAYDECTAGKETKLLLNLVQEIEQLKKRLNDLEIKL